ncbi:MAG: S-layer homology domain-containing protein [Clostridia bacterium]|nr:S-layer homology domain-containing protein [Clostridia bacterium]
MKKLLAALFAFVIPVTAAFSARASSGGDISPAIAVLKRATVLNKCALLGETVSFTKLDYETAIGADIRYLTVTALPEKSEGTLKVNGVNVISGQNVATGSLDAMTFVPADANVKEASFRFRACAEGWEGTDVTCRMVFTEKRNLPPSLIPEGVSVYKNASCEFTVRAFDPDGDDAEYVIDGYPVNGTLKTQGAIMVYTPRPGFTGEDSLILHAVDKYGGRSESTAFDITVTDAGLAFEDMSDSPVHTQAIALAGKNAIDYTLKDGKYYFEPKKTVTRIDFTVMLISARGISVDTPASALPFADTDAVPAGKKAYLAKAFSLGIAENTGVFRPTDAITRAEAASFAASLAGEEVSPQLASVIDALARSEDVPLTREDAARLLYLISE